MAAPVEPGKHVSTCIQCRIHLLSTFLTDPTLADPTLADLTTELEAVVDKWRTLGVKFGFSESQLNAIEMDHPHGGTSQWLSSTLDKRLKNVPNLSWKNVAEALDNIGCGVLAKEILRKYCTFGISQGLLYMYYVVVI